MKQVIIIDDIKPVSINSAYANVHRGRIKTQKASDYCSHIFFALDRPENQKKLEQLRNAFKMSNNFLSIKLKCLYPEQEFYNKRGEVSARTIDTSNWEKILIDCLCLPKFYDQSVPYGCKNLNIDDKVITDLVSQKRPWSEPHFRIEIEIEVLERSVHNNID